MLSAKDKLKNKLRDLRSKRTNNEPKSKTFNQSEKQSTMMYNIELLKHLKTTIETSVKASQARKPEMSIGSANSNDLLPDF